MALNVTTVSSPAPVTPAAFAAPTTSEQVANPGNDVLLWVKVGATATTITVVRPGDHPAGDPVGDLVVGPLTSEERIVPIGREYADSALAGDAAVTFDQVAGVTALLLRV